MLTANLTVKLVLAWDISLPKLPTFQAQMMSVTTLWLKTWARNAEITWYSQIQSSDWDTNITWVATIKMPNINQTSNLARSMRATKKMYVILNKSEKQLIMQWLKGRDFIILKLKYIDQHYSKVNFAIFNCETKWYKQNNILDKFEVNFKYI